MPRVFPFARYEIDDDGTSFVVRTGPWDARRVRRMDHASRTHTADPVRAFNRAAKNGDTILVTGDLPRFALMRTLPEPKLDPDLIKVGDGRIRIRSGGLDEWLDRADRILTRFQPGCTAYEIEFDLLPEIMFHYIVSQAGDWGAVAKLSVGNRGGPTAEVAVSLVYGGISRFGRTTDAAYFAPGSDDTRGNTVAIERDAAAIRCAELPEYAEVTTVPPSGMRAVDAKADIRHLLTLKPGETIAVYYMVSRRNHAAAERTLARPPSAPPDEGIRTAGQAEQWIRESRLRYEAMLAQSAVRTPSPALDAAFAAAVVNLDHVYAAPAWLEGVHWWSAPWVNNYQISAAIALGQLDRARQALLFFGEGEQGPCPIYMASGMPYVNEWHASEDGLPYYLYELLQYVEHSGDLDLLRRLWTNVRRAVARLFSVRDADGNHLLDWHMGCNAFMYQADNLGMPGDAASPSLMMAGMLKRLAAAAESIGMREDGARWSVLSDTMHERLTARLWNREAGVFYNHIDMQNIPHMAHYYTDHVFPVLYAQLPEPTGWQCIDYLERTLLLDSRETGGLLMRVGTFKPTLFGADNVMPAQMAETARAMCRIGKHDAAFRLLESVAWAGTVYTEAPGNFPERMNDEGKGEANYLFGNPVGSFLYSVVEGLFGLSLAEGGSVLRVRPAFPDAWDGASIALTYATMEYTSRQSGGLAVKSYRIRAPRCRTWSVSIQLEPCIVQEVAFGGTAVEYRLFPGYNRVKLEAELPAERQEEFMELTVAYRPVPVGAAGPATAMPGDSVEWTCTHEIAEIRDPQGVLAQFETFGNRLRGTTGPNEGAHLLFAALQDVPVVLPLRLTVSPRFSLTCRRVRYDLPSHSLTVEVEGDGYDTMSSPLTVAVNLMSYSGAAPFAAGENGRRHACVTIFRVEPLPEAVVELRMTVSVREEGRMLLHGSQPVVLQGANPESTAGMTNLRDARTIHLDLFPFYNADSIALRSVWRYESVPLDFGAAFDARIGGIATAAGTFRATAAGRNMAMVNYGMSDLYTRQTVLSDGLAKLVVPVGRHAAMISLLYASEVENRHTDTAVGSMALVYAEGEETRAPLVVGRQLDTLYSHFAADTVAVPLGEPWSIHVYRLPCRQEQRLEQLIVELAAADVQMGIIGVNVMTPGSEQHSRGESIIAGWSK